MPRPRTVPCQTLANPSTSRAGSMGNVEPERIGPSSRLITSSNLVVRGHSGPTQQRHTGCCAGSGCAPLFAACWK
jgi:hypothetical protein